MVAETYEELIEFSTSQEKPAKPKPLKVKKGTVHMVILGEGLNYYQTEKLDLSKSHTVEVHEFKYNIEPEALFLKRRMLRSDEYEIIFKQNDEKPILLKRETGITSSMLKIANESQAIRKAMSELFTIPFNLSGRKLIFLVVVIGAIAVAALVFTGTIDLGGIF